MKHFIKIIITSAILIFFISTANAQWTGTGPVTTTDNVGIGTSSPNADYKLDVLGGIRGSSGLFTGRNSSFSSVVGSAENGWLRDSWLTSNKYSDFKWDQTKAKWVRDAITYNDFGGILWQDEGTYFIRECRGSKVEYTNEELLNEAFMFADIVTNRIGMGTNSPQERLDVNGDLKIRGSGATIGGTNIANAFLRIGDNLGFDNNEIYFSGTTGYIGMIGAYPLLFKVNGAERMRIHSNGNIGIGTTAPAVKLDLFTNTDVYGIRIGDGANSNLRIAGTASGATGYGLLQTFTSGNTKGGNLILQRDAGNVGIGTTNPQSELAVNGTITSKIMITTQTGWSDFVFKNDYKLSSLFEVEQYIKENGHLPDVPSEDYIKTNGNNLGETDAVLLQKIEELTLYMIETNKKVSDLHSENQELNKENNELKTRIENLENKK